MKELLEELRGLTASATAQPTETGIPRVVMITGEVPEHQLAAVYEPMIGLVVQGTKILTIGNQVIRYDAPSYFVLPVGMPVTGTVLQGDGRAYLSVGLKLDVDILFAMLEDLPAPPESSDRAGFCVCPATDEFLDAWVRLLRLMKRPQEKAGLAPIYEREILFRALSGPQGWMLREIARPDSSLSQIHRAVQWLREHFTQSFLVKDVAQTAGMSVTVFHRHFKALTGLTPIQFQKQLRLLEARKALVSARPVSAVAFDVGYESVSQFVREYARFFGLPPLKDADRIRTTVFSRRNSA